MEEGRGQFARELGGTAIHALFFEIETGAQHRSARGARSTWSARHEPHPGGEPSLPALKASLPRDRGTCLPRMRDKSVTIRPPAETAVDGACLGPAPSVVRVHAGDTVVFGEVGNGEPHTVTLGALADAPSRRSTT